MRMNTLNIALNHLDLRRLPIEVGILLTFASVPLWLRMPYAPGTYAPLYAFGFFITLPMLFTIGSWLIAGLPGLRELRHDPVRLVGVVLLFLLVGWMHLSVSWSFIAEVRDLPNVAQSAAMRWTLVAVWVLVVACVSPPPRVVIAVLVVSAVIHALIGGAQVALQDDIGLSLLGEFTLDPQRSGVSIVESGGVRWLRAYGLQSHPNVLAGFLCFGLLASAVWILSPSHRLRIAGLIAAVVILWCLLLTFSRASWLGFAAGTFALLPFVIRWRPPLMRVVMAAGVFVLVVVLFFVLYSEFLVARVQVGESVEMRSVADRIVFTDFALRAASESPQNTLIGIGVGNFPWRSSYYIAQTDYDLRGANVHQMWLAAFVETGLVGFMLFVSATILALERGVRCAVQGRSLARGALVSGVMALGVIGLFDHYPWTMLQMQVLWWGALMVSAGAATPR